MEMSHIYYIHDRSQTNISNFLLIYIIATQPLKMNFMRKWENKIDAKPNFLATKIARNLLHHT